MRILVTGAGGFVGRHLVDELAANGHSVTAFEHPTVGHVEGAEETIDGDITDKGSVIQLAKGLKPEACIHLAAITFVPDAEKNPGLLYSVNVQGTLNLMDALKDSVPDCRVLTVSTAHVYETSTADQPIKESETLAPISAYAVSKAAADLATLSFAKRHKMHAMTARPHNHTGPGQAEKFVVPSFAKQLKEIAYGKRFPTVKVGNLDSKRDFTDVRDVVRAYRLLIEKGRAGEAYNIASNNLMEIGEVFNMLAEICGATPDIEVDQNLFRPTDSAPLLDVSKIEKDTGWKAEIDIETTLKDIVDSI